jgi:hypothetical protein
LAEIAALRTAKSAPATRCGALNCWPAEPNAAIAPPASDHASRVSPVELIANRGPAS